MFVSEKVSYRLKRVYIGIAMGVAIWLVYVSYLVLSSAINTNAPMTSLELTLTPLTTGGPAQK
ncbi:hypothetical protein [Polynucleobacter sp. MWH-UH25E]|uniref:hypothetical protein n=1 Tax=Polynucleobacter sp. MWH-UH25E TaxID=1855616 RepID=UPI001BFD66AA|nr:hypothetical protein [Polynucleobacter sp. MWH-UH25E]QWD61939.1 hypothetical protein ICV39_09380 [Polynucleobacter sp. MWH-UH25E]